MSENCKLCGHPALETQNLADEIHHQNCLDEWNNRDENGKCVFCGDDDQMVLDSGERAQTCEKCSADANSWYRGYPGP